MTWGPTAVQSAGGLAEAAQHPETDAASGIRRRLSLTCASAMPASSVPDRAPATSTPVRSRTAGYRDVNQPTVRERSVPATTCSSRPWPRDAPDTVAPAFPGDGQTECREQHVGDPCPIGGRHGGQHAPGQCRRYPHLDRSSRRDRVTRGIERPHPERRLARCEISRHNGSAPRIRSDSTASVSPTAQSRNDVPASARATVSPRRACSSRWPGRVPGSATTPRPPPGGGTATNTRPARPVRSRTTHLHHHARIGTQGSIRPLAFRSEHLGHELPATATRRTSAEVSGICSGTSIAGVRPPR